VKYLFVSLLFAVSCAIQAPNPGVSQTNVIKSFSRDKSLAEQYNDFMLTFPAEDKVASCKSINFRSDRRLRRNQKNLFLNNPQMAIPNYNGIYLLLENPISLGSEWFVVNCKSGRLESIFPFAGDIIFRPESRLIVTKRFGDFDTLKTFKETAFGLPEVYEWANRKWLKHDNPIQSK
jgi:hypothetical protein